MAHQAAHQRRDAPGLHEARDRSRGQAWAHPAGGPAGGVSDVVPLPREQLQQVAADVRSAAWFAALGDPLTEGDRADAANYIEALGLGALAVASARDWPEAERILKSPDASTAWWDREEALRRGLLATLEQRDRKSTRLNSSHLGISYA